MSRSPKTPAAAPAASPETPAEGLPLATVNLGELPAVVALVGLIGAIGALAGFPSRPIPDSLLQNLAKARETFLAALAEPLTLPALAAEGADAVAPYDDAWIKAAFEGLNEQLKDRFAALDLAIEGVTKSVADLPSVDLSAIEDRLAALEAAPPIDLAAIEGRVSAVEAAQAVGVAQTPVVPA